MAAIASQIYFRFPVLWRFAFRKAKNYLYINLLPISGLATSDICEGLKPSACQISTRYLSPRPRYYYFRFLKTNGHHIEILLPVSIFDLFIVIGMWFSIDTPTFIEIVSSIAELWRHNDFQDGGVRLDLVYRSGSPPTKCKWWSLLYPQISAWSDLQFWR